MADRKISDLTALTTPASGDYLPIVDISEAAAASKNKRITIEELMRGVPNGTAAAPGIAFETDPNTGIYSPGADQLAVATNGTQKIIVDSAGNVGIGAAVNATRTVQINQPSGYAAGLRILNGGSGAYNQFFSGTSNFRIGSPNLTSALVVDNGVTEYFRVTSAGLVGIGTSSPIAPLDCVTGSSGAIFRYDSASTYFSILPEDANGAVALRFSANNGAAPNLQFKNDTGQTRMTITDGGNVGIGTTGPSFPLHVEGAILVNSNDSYFGNFTSGAYVDIGSLATSAVWIDSRSASLANVPVNIRAKGTGEIGFHQTSGEKARLDSAGRLLVGTSSARAQYGVTAQTQVEGTSNDTASISIISNATAGGGANLLLGRSKGGSIGSNTTVASGDILGSIFFNGANGTNLANCGASVEAVVDGTVSGGGAGDLPTRLVFSTTADGAASPTERMRISANGNIDYGAFSTTPAGGTQGRRYSDSGRLCRSSIGTADTAPHHEFYNTNGSVGSIQTDGSATSYNTSSDYRLKENVVEVTDGITRLQQLKPSRFNFIVDPDKTVDGFIAHEAQAVVPECVTGEKDAVDADGNPVYQGIDQSKLVPLLTAALQEAIAKIESLEARLTAAGL